MPRLFCIPGIFFITCALVLLIIASISLPFLPDIDFVRVHIQSGTTSTQEGGSINQIKFGLWAFCTNAVSTGARICSPTGHAYSVNIIPANHSTGVTIGSSWTRGLAVHPVAAAVTFLALLFSFSTHLTLTLISSLLAFLAALLTFIAFLIDIALLAFVKDKMGDLNSSGIRSQTNTAPAFWLTFVSLILLLLGGCTVCFGRRRDRAALGAGTTSTYPSGKRSWNPFRRRY